jgi:hypothetical protein
MRIPRSELPNESEGANIFAMAHFAATEKAVPHTTPSVWAHIENQTVAKGASIISRHLGLKYPAGLDHARKMRGTRQTIA